MSLADPSLELARGLRCAIRERSERLAEVLAAYDQATDVTHIPSRYVSCLAHGKQAVGRG